MENRRGGVFKDKTGEDDKMSGPISTAGKLLLQDLPIGVPIQTYKARDPES